MLDLTTGSMLIISGEGTGAGIIERYEGARTARAISSRLSRERAHGDRWAEVWIEEPERAPDTYGKLGRGLDEIVDERTIPASSISDNPAGRLAAMKRGKSDASRENGKKGGRPKNQA